MNGETSDPWPLLEPGDAEQAWRHTQASPPLALIDRLRAARAEVAGELTRRGQEVHDLRNVGKESYRNILVEIKAR